jgi:hypothetical protein
MNCHRLPERCPDYHAGMLPPYEAELYERHLSGCAACRLQDAEYREGLGLLRPLPVPGPLRAPHELLSALQQAIEAALPGPSAAASVRLAAPPRRRLSPLRPLALAASLLVALLSALVLEQGLAPEPPAPAASAAARPFAAEARLERLQEADVLDAQWLAALELLEESLLAHEAGLGGEAPGSEGELDPEGLEEGLWLALAPEDGGLGDVWPEFWGALEDGIERLTPQQLEQLVELFERG